MTSLAALKYLKSELYYPHLGLVSLRWSWLESLGNRNKSRIYLLNTSGSLPAYFHLPIFGTLTSTSANKSAWGGSFICPITSMPPRLCTYGDYLIKRVLQVVPLPLRLLLFRPLERGKVLIGIFVLFLRLEWLSKVWGPSTHDSVEEFPSARIYIHYLKRNNFRLCFPECPGTMIVSFRGFNALRPPSHVILAVDTWILRR